MKLLRGDDKGAWLNLGKTKETSINAAAGAEDDDEIGKVGRNSEPRLLLKISTSEMNCDGWAWRSAALTSARRKPGRQGMW